MDPFGAAFLLLLLAILSSAAGSEHAKQNWERAQQATNTAESAAAAGIGCVHIISIAFTLILAVMALSIFLGVGDCGPLCR